ncbi:MAG: hypothetical protein KGM43_09770 [Planctomycetota bacterium]|nr:hypothetical protein [Planctomycetota bacterium]
MSSNIPPKEADAFTPNIAPRNRIGSPKPKHIEDTNDPIALRGRYLGREKAVKTLAHLVAAAASTLLFLGFAVMVVEIIGAKRFIDWDYFRPIIVFAILDAMMLAYARGLLLLRPWAPRLGGWLFVISSSVAGMLVLSEGGWISADMLIATGLPILSGFAGLLITWSKRTGFVFSDRYRPGIELAPHSETGEPRIKVVIGPVAKAAIIMLVAITLLGIMILVSK